jgi:glycosyltransferase involved in cell wall biosynthesis
MPIKKNTSIFYEMNKPRIAILLNGGIVNDGRVIKVVRTLSKKAAVDLFYIHPTPEDKELFDENVRLFPVDYDLTFKRKVIRHTVFYKEFDFLEEEVERTGVAYDIVYCNDLPTLKPGIRLKKRFGCQLIYDTHEIYIETINQFFPGRTSGIKGYLFSFLIWLMRFMGRRFEAKGIQEANTVITVNQSLADYFQAVYGLRQMPMVIYNCPVLDFSNVTPVDLRRKLDLPDSSVLLLYQGVLNEGRGLQLIIKVMKIMNPAFHLIIIGDGPLKEELMELVILLKLQERVHFIGRVPYGELAAYTRSADIGINLLEETNLSKSMALANKLFEYIHAGIPVLSTDTLEHRKIYDKFKVGVLTANTKTLIKSNLELIMENRKDYKELLQLAKQEYNWERQESILFELFKVLQN